jgi:ribosomal protein L29
MKPEELKNQTKDELRRRLDETRGKLRDLQFNIQLKQSKNVREIRKAKKLIARILTVLNEK